MRIVVVLLMVSTAGCLDHEFGDNLESLYDEWFSATNASPGAAGLRSLRPEAGCWVHPEPFDESLNLVTSFDVTSHLHGGEVTIDVMGAGKLQVTLFRRNLINGAVEILDDSQREPDFEPVKTVVTRVKLEPGEVGVIGLNLNGFSDPPSRVCGFRVRIR